MNWRTIKDDWPRLQESAGERWPKLTPEMLERIAGNRTVLMEFLQDEYDLTLEEAGVEADRWADSVSEHARDGSSD